MDDVPENAKCSILMCYVVLSAPPHASALTRFDSQLLRFHGSARRRTLLYKQTMLQINSPVWAADKVYASEFWANFGNDMVNTCQHLGKLLPTVDNFETQTCKIGSVKNWLTFGQHLANFIVSWQLLVESLSIFIEKMILF